MVLKLFYSMETLIFRLIEIMLVQQAAIRFYLTFTSLSKFQR